MRISISKTLRLIRCRVLRSIIKKS